MNCIVFEKPYRLMFIKLYEKAVTCFMKGVIYFFHNKSKMHPSINCPIKRTTKTGMPGEDILYDYTTYNVIQIIGYSTSGTYKLFVVRSASKSTDSAPICACHETGVTRCVHSKLTRSPGKHVRRPIISISLCLTLTQEFTYRVFLQIA